MNNDQIELFKQFMEFIQNVDKYKQVIVDLKDATDDYQQAYETLSKGTTIDRMQATLDANKVKFAKDMKDAQDSFNQQVETKTQYLADKAGVLGEKEAQLTQIERDLVERVNQIKKDEVNITTQLNDVQAVQSQLTAKEADLKQREVALTSKASQIQQLLG